MRVVDTRLLLSRLSTPKYEAVRRARGLKIDAPVSFSPKRILFFFFLSLSLSLVRFDSVHLDFRLVFKGYTIFPVLS